VLGNTEGSREEVFDSVETGFETELDEVDTRGTAWYIFNTLLPPQYSNLLSAQTMVHPPLTVDPVLVLPALITLPQ
jgi:hypothetical protein